jgi:transcriptional regulator with XRE-family HTH domain
MRDTFEPTTGKPLREKRSMSAVVALRREWRDVVPKFVRDDPRSSKELARAADVTPRAIDGIRQGDHGPSVPTFMLLAREIPELKAWVLRWLEAERDLDPDKDRLGNEIMRLVEKYEEARGRRAFNVGATRDDPKLDSPGVPGAGPLAVGSTDECGETLAGSGGESRA